QHRLHRQPQLDLEQTVEAAAGVHLYAQVDRRLALDPQALGSARVLEGEVAHVLSQHPHLRAGRLRRGLAVLGGRLVGHESVSGSGRSRTRFRKIKAALLSRGTVPRNATRGTAALRSASRMLTPKPAPQPPEPPVPIAVELVL